MQQLAGADDKYIVVFSYGYYVNPNPNKEYYTSDYSYYMAIVIDRNTGDMINTLDYGQYLSGNGFISDVKYYNGKITSKVYIEDEKGGRTVEMDNDSVSVVLPLDEDRLLVPVMSTSTNIPVFFEVDLKAAKAVEVDGKDYDWIDFDRVRNTLVNKDGRAYFSTSAGISTR